MASKFESASVFWDVENCHVPKNQSIINIIHMLFEVINNSIPITSKKITEIDKLEVVGKTHTFRQGLEQEFIDCKATLNKGINEKNFHKSGAADNELINRIHELMYDIDNKKRENPYIIVLISGDSDFISVLNTAKSRGFFVIIIHSNMSSYDLKDIANVSVPWTNFRNCSDIGDEYLSDVSIESEIDKFSLASNSFDSGYDAKPIYCKVRFNLNDICKNFYIPSDICICIGNIVKVEDNAYFTSDNISWNYGVVVSIHNYMKILPTLKVINVINNDSLIEFYDAQDIKQTNDDEIYHFAQQLQKTLQMNIHIVDAEIRWDEKNITILYLTDLDNIDFDRFFNIFKKNYHYYVQVYRLKRCTIPKCKKPYCQFYHP